MKRPLAAAVLATVVFTAGIDAPLAHAQAGAEASPAAMLERGVSQFEAGDLEAARATLENIDRMSLSREQRQVLYQTMEQIQTQVPQVPQAGDEAPPAGAEATTEAPGQPDPADEGPTDAQRLARADAAAAEDPGTAIAIYQSLIEEGGPSAGAAQARLAALVRGLNADLTRSRALLDEAEADLAADRVDAAASKLQAVQDSGVELGWFDQQRLERGMQRVAQAQAQPPAEDPAEPAVVVEADPPQPPAEEAPAEDAPAEGALVEDAPVEDAPVATQPTPPAPQSDLLAEARRAVAADYVREADEARSRGFNTLAVTLLSKAAQLDPDNEQIQRQLADLQNQDTPLDTTRSRINLQREVANASYSTAMNEAETDLSTGDYDGARDALNRARGVLENNAQVFQTQELQARQTRISNLAVTLNQRAERERVRTLEQTEQARVEAERERLAAAEAEQRRRVRELLTEARRLQKEMRYEEALLLVDQALFIDPLNWTAQLMQQVITDAEIIVRNRELRREQRVAQMRNQNANREAVIPYQELLNYPADWPELSERRIAGLEDASGESPADRETALKLRQSVPINFEANSLESVIDYFRETTGANIFVNWPTLALAGVEPDIPITLRLSDVAAENALDLVLQQANAGSAAFDPIGYSINDGVVTISTLRDLKRTTELRVYDIRDLLVQVPNFSQAPSFDLTEALSNTSTGGGGGGGGGGGEGLFGDTEDEDEEEEITRAELIEEITALIEETVGTIEEWQLQESTLRELNGNLIVKTTPDNHRQIVGLLEQLRQTRAIQISVEARFLLVSRNFLEEFALDLDARYTSSGNFGPITISQDTASLAQRDPSANPDLVFGRFFGAEDDGLPPRSLELGVSFIDDLEVDLMLRATLANRESISLTAPRVTFFNGQRAFVTVSRQLTFISDLEPVPDAAGFDITLSVVSTGAVLDVEGTISSDRRYVTLTLRPSLANLIALREFDVVGSTDIGGDDVGDEGEVVTFSASIQAPEIEITQIRATVSVPDRGTLLLGGQRLVGESEIEAGVPVMSKIPILNRLFTNTSTTQDSRTLLILIRPTILIQNEREDLLFPGLDENLDALRTIQ